MSVCAEDLLRYAEGVFTQAAGEPGYRNSVSRAYYAAMHRCRDFQAGDPGSSAGKRKKAQSHAKLINSLLSPESQDPLVRERSMRLGLDLQVMKTLRNVADYDLGRGVTKLDAEDAVERAKIVFDDI